MIQGILEVINNIVVFLMACVLEACNNDKYAHAHDRPKWENVVTDEYHSLMKNETWD